MKRALLLPLLFALSFACERTGIEPAKDRPDADDVELRSTPPPPSQSRTLKQGFTQRPPRDTPGLPPQVPPLLDEAERAALEEKRDAAGETARQAAQAEIAALVSSFESGGAADASDRRAILDRLRAVAVDDAKRARIGYATAESLYRRYLFPNDPAAADQEYAGRFVLLEGVVAPHNMLDLADGFKLFEETPYVHDPVLLATEYELSFVRCHLAAAGVQKLRDWEDVHVLGLVEGKKRGDVVLRRCVVL
jgi:hypothetical protein